MQRKAPKEMGGISSFRQIFRQLPERKLIIRADDPHFTIDDLTDSYAEMVDIDRDTVLGMPYFEAFPVRRGSERTSKRNLLNAFRAVKTAKEPQVQQIFRHDLDDPKTGQLVERYWRTTLYPVFDDKGEVTHILQVAANATEEVLSSRELEEARHHLEDALEAGKVGSWTWDIGRDIIKGNDLLASIFSLSESEIKTGIPLPKCFSRIHHDDRDRVKVALQHAINTSTLFDTEFRIDAGGKISWVIGRGRTRTQAGGVKAFSGVMIDVTERRNLQSQIALARRQDNLNRAEAKLLQQRNEELQALSRSKEEFVALASHQLRTPATAVKQYLGMVLQGYAGDITSVQREMLEKAFESNERQVQIINQILNAARADTGKLVMTTAPMELVAMVRGIIDEAESQITEHGHTLDVSLPAEEIIVSADSGYLRMAVENLINNANKYTPNGGKITISIKKTQKNVTISVKDTGVGIGQDDLGKLFVKFSRIHNPLSIQAGGSGIGLYLAREIVRLHGGKLSVRSRLDEGTCFSISLPLN